MKIKLTPTKIVNIFLLKKWHWQYQVKGGVTLVSIFFLGGRVLKLFRYLTIKGDS